MNFRFAKFAAMFLVLASWFACLVSASSIGSDNQHPGEAFKGRPPRSRAVMYNYTFGNGSSIHHESSVHVSSGSNNITSAIGAANRPGVWITNNITNHQGSSAAIDSGHAHWLMAMVTILLLILRSV